MFTSFRKSFQPVDRVALLLMAVLSVAIGVLLLTGSHTTAQIRDFSWQNRQVGAEDAAFMLSFSRPMDHASVEQNLRLDPELPGKFSWAGRRMAYTLTAPAPYGQTFQLKLAGAHDRFSGADERTVMPPFTGQFRSRDRAFVYLGATGEAAGRLVLQNLTTQQQTILTPANLTVMDFQPYPQSDRILFSAADRSATNSTLLDQQLYSVTTGIHVQAPASPGSTAALSSNQPAGKIDLLLDNKDYQNLKFDLSTDGQTIVVQRVSRKNPSDFGLWILKPNSPARSLNTQPGGDFLIAPDGTSLAMAQGQGMAILPLQEGAKPLDFLAKYGMVLSFAHDGTAAAMVKFNNDPQNPTRSLFLVTNQGVDKKLMTTDGSIYSAEFDPVKKYLYCLYSKRIPGEDYNEQPYLAAIDLGASKLTDLLRLPIQQDIQMNLAPDGVALLFDQVIADGQNQTGLLHDQEGKAIATSRLWLLPILQDPTGKLLPSDPQELGIAGLRPRWLP